MAVYNLPHESPLISIILRINLIILNNLKKINILDKIVHISMKLHLLTEKIEFDKIFSDNRNILYIFMSLIKREHYSRKGSELTMDMKVHLPVATLPLDNGCEYYYFNSQFLPIFYRIPKEILEIRGKELLWIPRTPASAYYDAEVIKFVESDIFMNGLINCVAYMIWPYLNVSPKMEVYSEHDSAWIVAYSLAIWVKGFIDYDGMWDARELKSQVDSFLHFRFPYIPMEESQKRLSYIVPQVMRQYNIDKVIEVIKENRCFEDFVDNWESNQKIDFTPTIVNTLIKRIDVHNPDEKFKHRRVKIDIYFTAVGLISIPDEKELLTLMDEIRNEKSA